MLEQSAIRTLARSRKGACPSHRGGSARKLETANTSPPSTRARARARDGDGNQRPWPADKVERWPIDRLIPYAKNARTHSDAQGLEAVGEAMHPRDVAAPDAGGEAVGCAVGDLQRFPVVAEFDHRGDRTEDFFRQ
jgi:hypothetical protein